MRLEGNGGHACRYKSCEVRYFWDRGWQAPECASNGANVAKLSLKGQVFKPGMGDCEESFDPPGFKRMRSYVGNLSLFYGKAETAVMENGAAPDLGCVQPQHIHKVNGEWYGVLRVITINRPWHLEV